MKKSSNGYRGTITAGYISSIVMAMCVGTVPLLFVVFNEDYSLSMEMLGRLILINFVTQLGADLLSIKFVPKVGYRAALVFANAMVALGMILFGTLPLIMQNPYAGLVIATVIYSFGLGVIEANTSAVLDSLPSEAKASDMSLMHSIFCWGQAATIILTTVALKLLGAEKWYVVVWATVVLAAINAVLYLKVPFAPPLPPEEQIPVKKLMGKPIFMVALLLMLCAGASELSMSQWASFFAEKGLGVSKVMGDLLGPCMFAVFMGIGRTVYGIFGAKIKLEKALLWCSVLCIAGYVGTTIIPIPVLSLVCCALCGLAVSLMWPGMLSLCAERFHGGGAAMFAMLAVFGDLGCSVGPWFTGIISDKSTLNIGLLASVIFPIIMFAGVISFAKNKKAEAK